MNLSRRPSPRRSQRLSGPRAMCLATGVWLCLAGPGTAHAITLEALLAMPLERLLQMAISQPAISTSGVGGATRHGR